MPYSTILVPVDESGPSARAVEHAAALAVALEARVVLMTVYSPVPEYLGRPNFETVAARRKAKAHDRLRPLQERLEERGAMFAAIAVAGSPVESILDVAKAEQADLIVMGSRGKTDLKGLILGSTAHSLLHAAPCPVLLVR